MDMKIGLMKIGYIYSSCNNVSMQKKIGIKGKLVKTTNALL